MVMNSPMRYLEHGSDVYYYYNNYRLPLTTVFLISAMYAIRSAIALIVELQQLSIFTFKEEIWTRSTYIINSD